MYNQLVDFLIKERILTFSVLTGMLTFQFISSFKLHVLDPLMELVLPDRYFDFLKIYVNEEINNQTQNPLQGNIITEKPIIIDFGYLLKEIIKWTITIMLLFILYKSFNQILI